MSKATFFVIRFDCPQLRPTVSSLWSRGLSLVPAPRFRRPPLSLFATGRTRRGGLPALPDNR
jgi:hypothetical protein